MQVNVIFFGVLSDVVGKNMLTIQDTDNMADLKSKLIISYPDLKDYTFRMAVNQQMVEDNHLLFDNDLVAVMPPFAGG
ncbi:MAG: MoaD/ThiS family protein [Gammaproteobacteria bacterium]|jgi:molybdopterin synthase sulfur carrier subunit|nr:MoaD/ThiS family protein [Gammaproteobacteria bacterium]NBT44426.1 MoaD/ThiS family protein [Gammaproteobacteria bacterium]NBY21690.1 MoaD/ThiS family protein [Gammaproteobacteria bacterium]NDG88971.1 MoaD/ThiS family protein [Gammaproteobacteria bacterium]